MHTAKGAKRMQNNDTNSRLCAHNPMHASRCVLASRIKAFAYSILKESWECHHTLHSPRLYNTHFVLISPTLRVAGRLVSFELPAGRGGILLGRDADYGELDSLQSHSSQHHHRRIPSSCTSTCGASLGENGESHTNMFNIQHRTKKQATNNKQQATSNQQRATSNKQQQQQQQQQQQATGNRQQATSGNKQEARSKKQEARSKKQQATSNKQQATATATTTTTTNNNKQQQTTTNNNKQQQTTTNNNKQQQATTSNKQQATSNKQQTTSLKQQTTNNKQQTTSNKQQATSNKQQATNNKQQATSNKQQTTNNKQQTTNNKQQTTNNKQQTTNNKQTNKPQTNNNQQQSTTINNNQQQSTTNNNKQQQTTTNNNNNNNNNNNTAGMILSIWSQFEISCSISEARFSADTGAFRHHDACAPRDGTRYSWCLWSVTWWKWKYQQNKVLGEHHFKRFSGDI